MFAHDETGNVFGVDAIMGGHNLSVTESVQGCSGAEYFAFRIVEFILCDVGDRIHRIGDQNEDGILCILRDAAHDFADLGGIFFAHQGTRRHVFTGTRFFTYAGRDDDHIGIRAVGVITGIDFAVGPVAGG